MIAHVLSLFLVLQTVSCFQGTHFQVMSNSKKLATMSMAIDCKWETLKKPLKFLATASLMFQFSGLTSSAVRADEVSVSTETAVSSSSSTSSSSSDNSIPKVPLFTKRSNDLQVYTDINRGFKMLR